MRWPPLGVLGVVSRGGRSPVAEVPSVGYDPAVLIVSSRSVLSLGTMAAPALFGLYRYSSEGDILIAHTKT